eukprot:1058454-Prorocentrum_minimum.AAC.4
MVKIEDVDESAQPATGNWRHKGQWVSVREDGLSRLLTCALLAGMQDPSDVDYEIEDMDLSGIVELLMEAGNEIKELRERIDILQVSCGSSGFLSSTRCSSFQVCDLRPLRIFTVKTIRPLVVCKAVHWSRHDEIGLGSPP